MFTISRGDIWRGFVISVISAVVVAVTGVLNAVVLSPGFDAFSVDWQAVMKNITNVVIIASYSSGTSYIIKNFFTDEEGAFLGIKTRT